MYDKRSCAPFPKLEVGRLGHSTRSQLETKAEAEAYWYAFYGPNTIYGILRWDMLRGDVALVAEVQVVSVSKESAPVDEGEMGGLRITCDFNPVRPTVQR